jgi:hypothetical protein
MAETLLSPSNIILYGRVLEDIKIVEPSASNGGTRHDPFATSRTGINKELENQVTSGEAVLARIYGFSYEGSYSDLPRPAVFLVHGMGVPVTPGGGVKGGPSPSRAPGDPSLSGVVATDIQWADGIKAWSYDKADQTIRMDTAAGTFEQVLLGMTYGDGPAVSGAMVSGAMVSGGRGPRVSGNRVSGAMLRGGGASD